MATAAFRLTLKDFGVCWLIPGDSIYVGRRKLVTWTLYRDRPWVALVSFQVRSRSSKGGVSRGQPAQERVAAYGPLRAIPAGR